jgi:DNA-binding NtrC family response regulator
MEPVSKLKIFTIENTQQCSLLLSKEFNGGLHYSITSFDNFKKCLGQKLTYPNIIILDEMSSVVDCNQALGELKKKFPHSILIILSEKKDVKTVIDFITLGAYDCLGIDELIKRVNIIRLNLENKSREIIPVKTM